MVFDKLRYLFFLLFILLSFTVSCGNNEIDEVFIDKSFINKEPCVAPCWYGLELEKSTEEDVFKVLKQLPFVRQDSITQKGTGWMNDYNATSISYQCSHQENATCGWIDISENRVVRISINVKYDLDFSSIVSELGEPDYINYYSPQHYTGCIITLDWPEKQISVTGGSEEKCPAKDTQINPDIKATNLIYTTHKKFALVDEQDKYPWPGFAEP